GRAWHPGGARSARRGSGGGGGPAMTTPQDAPFRASRRTFLAAAARAAAGLGAASALEGGQGAGGADRKADKPPVIDTHMHVWSGDADRFPFAHPYDLKYTPLKIAATVELLLKEMDEFGISHCVLVQTINHGWDNRYLARCLKAHP